MTICTCWIVFLTTVQLENHLFSLNHQSSAFQMCFVKYWYSPTKENRIWVFFFLMQIPFLSSVLTRVSYLLFHNLYVVKYHICNFYSA